MKMILRSLTLICFGVAVQCITLEPVDFVDVVDNDRAVRSYPVLKVSFYNPKNLKKTSNHKGNSKASKLTKASKFKNENIDNVREFHPTSREDIRKLKKLSFHGRSSPNSNATETKNVLSHSTAAAQTLPAPPTQVDYKQRKYSQQQLNDRSETGSKKIPRKTFVSIDKGFLPLMRPSPINVHPVDPPSFHTMRNYVNYLKLRQKQFFSELDDVKALNQKELPGEIEYLVKREKEVAEEQQASPEHRGNEDVEIEEIEDHHKESADESEEEVEEESKRHDTFVPFRMYAQVRHVEAENHKPKSEAPSAQAKERLTLEKKNVYYKEEGYEEKDYDHGDETVDSKFRVKRSAENSSPALKDKRSLSDSIYSSNQNNAKSYKYPYYNLPDSNTLNTMSAFRYSENMKNFPQAKQSLYSFKNVQDCQEIDQEVNPVPDDIDEEGKNTKFNEKPKRLRNLGDKINCYKNKYFGKEPFDNPLFKEEFVSTSIPMPSQFLAHQVNPLIAVYDDVISNIRAAFDDELKQQREDEALKVKQEHETLKIKRDQEAFDFKSQQKIPTTAVPPQIPASNNIPKASTPEIRVVNLNSPTSAPRLPIFDINSFHPKLIIPLNDQGYRNVKSDYEMEFFELPIVNKSFRNPLVNRELPPKPTTVVPQNPTSGFITNLRPPQQEKRRRRNPIIKKNHFNHVFSPPSTYFQPPITQDRNKFKLF